MKTRIVLLLIPALLLISCGEDFTQLSPISQRNAQNFYQTATDFQVAINGAYDALQSDGTFGRSYILLLEMRGDNGENGGGATGLAATLEALDNFNEISTAEELETAWSGSYAGISRCNIILSRLPDADFDQALKDRIRGEALFIRSLIYYKMAVLFGNIPIQLEEVSSPDLAINQVPATEIYDQIAGDLETAEGLLPETYADPTDLGRATKGAAATLLGKVLLTDGDNAGAETALRRVVEDYDYDLVPNFADVWDVNNEHNQESIFEINYIAGGVGEGSGFTDFYTPFGSSGGVGGGNAPQDLTDEVIDSTMYDNTIAGPKDERYWGTFDTTDTGDYYVRKFESVPFGPFDADNNWIELRYADALLMLAEAIGESPEAYGYINQVRNRAGLPDIGAGDPGTFEEKLLRERRFEFLFENKRWEDLRRFGVTKQVMSAHLGVAESEIKLLYPIPQREIDVSPDDMQQNPEHTGN